MPETDQPTPEEIEAALDAAGGTLWWDGASFHRVPEEPHEEED